MRPFLAMARLSWPVQASLVCLAFLLVGIVVVDDYGASYDVAARQAGAQTNLAFIMGYTDRLEGFGKGSEHNKYYGVAFDLPLLLLEYGLGPMDRRSIYLLRHLVTHGVFLVGGLCCSLLVYRLTRSRGVALFALLLFVLQPRLYAHSFFNSKDLPFLSLFMVTLYVTHRAFRTETVGAFVLCGVCVGVLTNLRIMGAMLFPAVLALRGLDLLQAGRGTRTHVLVTGAGFALAGPGTLYALSPYLWADPLEFGTAWQTLAQHPNYLWELFQGRLVSSKQVPWHYIPTWMTISTPPVTLVCGVLGAIRVGLQSIRGWREAVGNTDLRFGLLLVVCLTLPVLAIIALDSHLYDGWRHVYFLHAPLCGLAGLGVQWVGGMRRQAKAGIYTLAGLGVLGTGGEMVRLHPHQHVYFNVLVDRTTPEYLRRHYVLDPWRVSCREGLEFLRRRYPATTVYVRGSWPVELGWMTLPPADRAWLVPIRDDDVESVDFRISCGEELQPTKREGGVRVLVEDATFEDTVYERTVYGSTLVTVTAQVTVPDRKRGVAHRIKSWRGITAGRLVAKGRFDLYTYPGGRLLGYARNGCTPSDTRPWFFVHIVPVDVQELRANRRRHGYENRDFSFFDRGQAGGGQCWAMVHLPGYEIARVRTGQYTKLGGRIWETELVGPLP